MESGAEGQKAAPSRPGISLDYVPRKQGEVLELDMGDGFILYNDEANLVHHLTPQAAIVWQLLDGDASVAQLGREIAEEYGLEPARIHREVADLVAELDALGLVEDARATSTNSE